MNNTQLLTPIQSFYAMQLFLEDYFNTTSSDSIGALLSGMQFLEDGQTADPVFWQDWCEIVANNQISLTQGFQAMKMFLDKYYQATSSDNVKNMLKDINLTLQDKEKNDSVWQKWVSSVKLALIS